MKDKIFSAFGTIGLIIWYIVSCALMYAPLYFIGFPWWANLIVIVIILSVPVIGDIIELASWIWGFTIIVHEPFGFAVVWFYVAFVVYLVLNVIPRLLNLFTKNRN